MGSHAILLRMNQDFHADIARPSITFFGATESVHGSMHLLDTGFRRILFDCGRNNESHSTTQRNPHRRPKPLFPFAPAELDAVLLTHAHSDHCGNLPYLVKQGFEGPIYCSQATRELIEIILHDNARMNEQEKDRARYYSNPLAASRSRDTFGHDDVDRTLDQCQTVSLAGSTSIDSQIQFRAYDSAHVLGSVMYEVDFESNVGPKKFVFTGDLGRRGLPFVGAPGKVPAGDLIVCESTYGGRSHEPFESTMEKLCQTVRQSMDQGGKVLIPAFSLGRVHLVRYCLVQAMERGDIPTVPIYLDSPLSEMLEDVYREFYEPGLLDRLESRSEWLMSSDEAWFRTTQREPAIIVASGGMCDGGRILDHLKYHIDDPRASLILVSHQSETSLGAQLLQPSPTVRFHGRIWNKWIQVKQISGFSAHADTDDFEFLLGDAIEQTGKVCLVHGEAAAKTALKHRLDQLGFGEVIIPTHHEIVEI
jgi:metallo-beta-lactamase family protein